MLYMQINNDKTLNSKPNTNTNCNLTQLKEVTGKFTDKPTQSVKSQIDQLVN